MLHAPLKIAKKYDYLNDKFTAAYAWLEQNDVVKMEDGRYDIADGVFALVQRYCTVPFEEARFEAHNDYFDIQYLAQGKESLGVAWRDQLEVTEERLDVDCIFFKHPEHYTAVNLQPGDFICLPPEEAHQPRAAYNGKCENVVKVVVKVAVK